LSCIQVEFYIRGYFGEIILFVILKIEQIDCQ
jgi:hypothetical protein